MSFEQTPLFQLNLMIFLSWPSPSVVVDPLFYKEGYELYKIGPRIPTALEAQARANSSVPPIPFTPRPSPDIVLRHTEKKTILIIECKKQSFGPDSKQASQAASLLSCVGQHVASVFGLPSEECWSSFLCYAMGDSNISAMQDTINALATKLEDTSIPVTDSGCISITVLQDGVYMAMEPRSRIPLSGLQDATQPGIKVMPLADGDDPRPLYLIPIDPSITVNDDYEKSMLSERVRMALASLLGSQLDQGEFAFELDDVMRSAIEVWDMWADYDCRKYVKNAVRSYLRLIFREVNKVGLQVTVDQDRLMFHHVTPSVAADTRRYLSSAAFRKGQIDLWSSSVQPDFSNLAHGW